MKRWWCMQCQAKVALNKHGRCETCESEAVDPMRASKGLNRPVSSTCKDAGASAVSGSPHST
jgi:hypothetical protein